MRAACIQLCSGTVTASNIAVTDRLIRAAVDKGAVFIATPENTALMAPGSADLFAKISPENECRVVKHFSGLARKLGVDILIGSIAIKLSESKAANRSYLFGSCGAVKARYDKIHMFDATINETEIWKESENYQAGETPIITEAGGFKIGMSICYDLRFANLYKYYAAQGVNVLTVPAAFTAITGKDHWEVLLRARAIETSSYIIAPAQGGTHHNGRTTWGHSMIIDPWGKIIAQIDGNKPGFCLADLSMDMLNDIRGRIPAWQQNTQLS